MYIKLKGGSFEPPFESPKGLIVELYHFYCPNEQKDNENDTNKNVEIPQNKAFSRFASWNYTI